MARSWLDLRNIVGKSMSVANAGPKSEIWWGLWNYVSLSSSTSHQIRTSNGMTDPVWRMMNNPVQNSCSTVIISVMWMLSLCHKNMYSVQRVETNWLCCWSHVHVNTTGWLWRIMSHNWIWILPIMVFQEAWNVLMLHKRWYYLMGSTGIWVWSSEKVEQG